MILTELFQTGIKLSFTDKLIFACVLHTIFWCTAVDLRAAVCMLPFNDVDQTCVQPKSVEDG